jgi:hypothetical protein
MPNLGKVLQEKTKATTDQFLYAWRQRALTNMFKILTDSTEEQMGRILTSVLFMGSRNVSPFSLISPHFYPVILNSFPNKLYYHFSLLKQRWEIFVERLKY